MSDENNVVEFDPDQLHSKLQKWKADEERRKSDAGETRQDIGQFIEDTGLNKKALSFVRSLDKMAEEKRADVLLSLDSLFDEMRPHWQNQGTAPMDFGSDEPEDTVVPIQNDGPDGFGDEPDQAA